MFIYGRLKIWGHFFSAHMQALNGFLLKFHNFFLLCHCFARITYACRFATLFKLQPYCKGMPGCNYNNR